LPAASFFGFEDPEFLSMRIPLLLVAAALTLSACKNNDQHDNTMNVDENLTAENIVSNDVTAIDAVTGADANMAADVNYSNATLDNGDTASDNAAAPSSSTAKPKAPKKAAPAPTNTAADATTNAE
jgi:hypothetical protein